MSSVHGYTDEVWFDRYFGVHDKASTYFPGMQRNLAQVLPMGFGIHFPNASGSAHESRNESIEAMQLKNMETLGDLKAYSGLLDWATTFYVPELTGHVKQFQADGIPMLQRSYKAQSGELMHSVIVYTPGSGHVMELQSDACDACDGWATFTADECELGHRLPRPASYYRAAWINASSATGMWKQVGNRLPPNRTTGLDQGVALLTAPMIVQIRQAVTDLAPVQGFLSTILHTELTVEGCCKTVSAITGVAPFDDKYRGAGWSDYPLQFAYVLNAAKQDSIRPFVDFLERLHSERVGFGWGWDRGIDYHVKFTDSGSMNVETSVGVPLDHWAASLTAHGVRFSTFNLSQHCPQSVAESEDPARFGGASMLYTAGPGLLGFEFWGFFDYTFFSADQPHFSWGGVVGSPTGDCRSYLSPPDCSTIFTVENVTTIRARVSANPPTNDAYATLYCPAGHFIEAVNFARFGTPAGDCEAASFVAASSDSDIKGLVETLCVGRTNCRVPASTALFGKPYTSRDGWWVATEARCSQANATLADVIV
jgi:hypothetical protein